uniref:palmitoyl-CoA hydrolase n=1 Tax=Strigamia maritima TaxID=126957 RepID=T1J9W8_STRMM
MNVLFQITLITFWLTYCTAVYRPTAIIHGIMFNPTDRMEVLKRAIEESQPGTTVDVFELWFGVESFLPMWRQVSGFYGSLLDFMGRNPGPINLIGYSQGGLIARGVLNVMANHTVQRFISLSSPQNGFHGEFYVPDSVFNVGNEEKYSGSVGGFWKDPRDMIRYKKEGRFLACINNEYAHAKNQQFKTTMCKLEQLVLIGGPNDGVVVPWESALFGYDDANGRVTNMEEQAVYKSDSFCLKTLDRRGAITRYIVPGVRHPDWHNNASVINSYILPHLLMLLFCCVQTTAIIHGIMFNDTDRMAVLKNAIESAQPGSVVDVFELNSIPWYGIESFLPMWRQVSGFSASLELFTRRFPGPINLIGYSQGGLIARGVLNVMPNHNVKRFVSLSAPQNGFHGEVLLVVLERYDPTHMSKYKKEGRFLACINNEYKHKI